MPETPMRPVELYRARTMAEAHALRVQLETAGIVVHIDNEMLQGIVGEVPGGWMTAPTLLVSSEQLETARVMLDMFLDEADDAAEEGEGLRCLACRTPMEEADSCPQCGWSYSSPTQITDGPPEAEGGPPTTEAATPSPLPSPSSNLTGKAAWGEVIAVLAVGVFPNLFGAILSLNQVVAVKPPYWADSMSLAGMAACTIFVVLYLIQRSGDSWNHFGLDRPSWIDVPLTLGMLLIVMGVVLCYFRIGITDDGSSNLFAKPQRESDYAWMVVKLGLAAFAEELVARAFLITRLEVLLGSKWLAVVFAAIAFASYHVYQGPAGAVYTLLFGLAFGFAYLCIRRIWPLAAAHAIHNIALDLGV